MLVEVYRNLHKKCYSIRQKGRVLYHANSVVMRDCEFRVQQGGRRRVLQERKKNVHAYIKGDMITASVITRWTWAGDGKRLEAKREREDGTDWLEWDLDTIPDAQKDKILMANAQRRWFKVRYNPYYMPHFFAVCRSGDIPVQQADWVHLDKYGGCLSGATAKLEFIEHRTVAFADMLVEEGGLEAME